MKNFKKTTLLAVIFTVGLVGCGGNPVPAEAIKACLESKGVPLYYSNCCNTQFVCGPEGTQSLKFK